MNILSENPFTVANDLVSKIIGDVDMIFVDFHAEASAEKIAMGIYLDGKATAVYGTHTHVQTADEQIMNDMAYITDAGFCGAENGVIGMEYTTSLTRMTTCLPERFEVAQDNVAMLNAVEFTIDALTGKATEIKRINEKIVYENNKEVNLAKEQT